MNLRQLEIFYAIMQVGTVSGAAKNLNVSQPNVTRVLAHTEQQMGFALFERVKGRLVPTQEAKTLLPEAEKIYQQLGQFRSLTNKVKKGNQHLRIGAPPILANALLTPVIAKLSHDPALSIELSTANRNELCDGLLKNELDLAVCFGEEAPAGITQQTLLKEAMCALLPCSEQGNKQWSGNIELNELVSHPAGIIGLDSRDPLGLSLSQAIHQVDPHYHSQITVRSYSAAAELVLHHAGIAVVDPWTAQHYQQAHYLNRLSARKVSPDIAFSVSLLHAEHQPISLTAQYFSEQLIQSIKGPNDQGIT
ncbi:LysR family transcriptional regulator [Vibrio sp. Of7-15]|uniref:LysR family transcriptional regulator n=1 Tax=Vibrio sp. Of7-15 TaxID=2724879 RepID=UPI001EF2F8D0|nr:LysR family transcriptional regulator [Vibrio sp. Of7-15]MCG7499587.1 LysR family transcriptional regulator [Vibrio sp. Of7-15]